MGPEDRHQIWAALYHPKQCADLRESVRDLQEAMRLMLAGILLPGRMRTFGQPNSLLISAISGQASDPFQVLCLFFPSISMPRRAIPLPAIIVAINNLAARLPHYAIRRGRRRQA